MLQFNDTTTYRGIVQTYERECGFDHGDISGSTTKLKDFTADANLWLDRFTMLAIRSSGRWQWDDSNHTDYPIITTNLVANQRDYPFTTDEGGNLILDIYRVLVADDNGDYREVSPIDAQTADDTTTFWDGNNTTGVPTRYDKTANGIFLDPIPSYNETNGLKIYINREASYFVYTDTTKKPGIPGLFHRYLAIGPASEHARRNVLTNRGELQSEVLRMEEDIQRYFSERPRDEPVRLSVGQDSNR